MSASLKDLLGRLIQVDLSKRIGNLKNGVTDIKDHVWFDKINWVALANKEVSCCTFSILAHYNDLQVLAIIITFIIMQKKS